MNNKGFTLIELLATIMLLSIIMTVTTVFIINLIDSSKERSYELLVEDIKIAAQGYFEECENKNIIDSNITCPNISTINYTGYTEKTTQAFPLNYLLDFGFLNGTSVEENNERKILNPKTNDNIGECTLKVTKKITNDTRDVTYTFTKITNSILVGGKSVICPTY